MTNQQTANDDGATGDGTPEKGGIGECKF